MKRDAIQSDHLERAALATGWLALCLPSVVWLAEGLTEAEGRLNVLLLIVLGLWMWRERGRNHDAKPLAGDRSNGFIRSDIDPWAAITLIVGVFGSLAARHVLGIKAVTAVLSGVAAYGALGLYLRPQTFRRGWPVAMLAVLFLPMGGHLDTYLGFPLRLGTAELVQRAMSLLGFRTVTRETVILFENAAAQVDLPCSGVRSLWAGMVFFLGASGVAGARIGWRWVSAAAAFVLLLLGTNTLRVLILSLLAFFVKDPLIAKLVHVPLGVTGFVLSCAVSGWMLFRAARTPVPAKAGAEAAIDGTLWRRYVPVLLLALATLPVPSGPDLSNQAFAGTFRQPDGVTMEPETLTQKERLFLGANGAAFQKKWRFRSRGQSGSLLVVGSRSWRAHHPPEQCLAGAGHALAASETRLLAPDFPVRFVHFAGEGDQVHAAYWFQTRGYRTADHAARVFAGLKDNGPWLMVSLLFDQPLAGDDLSLTMTLKDLAAAANDLLNTEQTAMGTTKLARTEELP